MTYLNHTNKLSTINNQKFQTHNWITSELLIGMYSGVFTNLLLVDNQLFK
ncbi:hypothetical protein C5L30_001285 [Companilactobacillus farciminis]|uniref:Uncharacterized protein n=1 Tax=Companilactobacillus farciminis TaxID=1612 RepID=A0A4R5NGZ7_9LACO|nr:hypothetical protein [Companilactobacillus farciminis]TDG73793.1 hypothetical protein C5L30_001285 [Companilactobacillus farciminis]WCG35982.1 hypothetical protein PML84_02025 [Companilactobacillus farciminis]HJF87405.1 hypothetical protein [Companilactobacillus farciminis]